MDSIGLEIGLESERVCLSERGGMWERVCEGGRAGEVVRERVCVHVWERMREGGRRRGGASQDWLYVHMSYFVSTIPLSWRRPLPFILPNFFSYASLPSSFFIYLLSFSLYHTSHFLHSFYSLLISLSFYHPLKIYLMIYFVFLIKEKSKKKWKSEKKYI